MRLLRLVKAIRVIDRNRKPRPKPRSRMAPIMSSAPLSLVEPDSIHIATMIIRIPKGTVANGGNATHLEEEGGDQERADEQGATGQ